MDLSPSQRLALIKYVNSLMQPEFESLLYALNPSDGVIPPNLSAQGNRSAVLLKWVESPTGCGMSELLGILGAIAPLPPVLAGLSHSGAQAVEAPSRSPARSEHVSPIASGEVQIFLAHAKEDEAQVMELYERLREKGYRPWLDKKDLIAGQNWRNAIPKAISESDLVMQKTFWF